MHDLLTEEQYQQLLKNGHPDNRDNDHYPVVKIFMLHSWAKWLLTELDSENPDIAFGLCDLGHGFPELGYVSLNELASIDDKYGWPVVQDDFFKAIAPISVYAQAARLAGEITEDAELLSDALRNAVPPSARLPRPQP